MKEIDINDYFIEIIDEGRSTIGYDCVQYKTKELVHKIYKQNDELKRLEQENEKLKIEIGNLEILLANAESDLIFEEDEKLKVREKCSEIMRYKQTLEEIRECAKTEISEIMTRTDYDGFLALKGILAKINEVLK